MPRMYTHIKESKENIFTMKAGGIQTEKLLNVSDPKINKRSRDWSNVNTKTTGKWKQG